MLKKMFSLASVFWLFSTSVFASDTYVVQKNDSLWKIAVKFQIGVNEIIQTNPQFKDPNLIFPGQKVFVSTIDELRAIEQEVIRLTYERRVQAEVDPLAGNKGLVCSGGKQADARVDKCSPTHDPPI